MSDREDMGAHCPDRAGGDYNAVYREIFINSPEPQLILENDIIVDINHAAGEMLDFARNAEALHTSLLNHVSFAPECGGSPEEVVAKMVGESLSTGCFSSRVRIHSREGDTAAAVLSGKLISMNGKARLHVTLRTLNEDNAVAADRSSGNDRTPVPDIQHWILNNLQIVMSFMDLQKNMAPHKSVEETIEDLKNRVFSLALNYQNIEVHGDAAVVNMGRVLRNQMRNLIFQYREGNVSFSVDVGDVGIGIDTALYLTIITNELVSGMLKNGPRGDAKGHITLRAKDLGHSVVIMLNDTWRGAELPGNDLIDDSLGQFIVANMSIMLGLKIVSNHDGERYAITVNKGKFALLSGILHEA